MKKKGISSKHLFLVITFLLIATIIGATLRLSHRSQLTTDKIVEKSGYPEIRGKRPTFQAEIVTQNSKTYVISYLPETLLPREKFHADAAQKAIAYVEEFASKKPTFSYNPYKSGGSEMSTQLLLRQPGKRENVVILFSDNDPMPHNLKEVHKSYNILSTAISNNQTFFFTISGKKGATSFLRFSEPNTWGYGLPTKDNKKISPLSQLNVGFNIETWKRTVVVSVNNTDLQESIWNTFGQLMVAAQENTPLTLLENRYNKERAISPASNRVYYPFDEKARAFFLNAPKDPVIR